MKTANLTRWCNLFSIESKYSIDIRKSRYRVLLHIGCAIALILLLFVFFTFAYHEILAISFILICLLGYLATKKRESQTIVSTFELTSDGQCRFDEASHYQIQRSSRQSFLGCWLVLQKIPTNSVLLNTKDKTKRLLFIYRDSLSEQDFSRLSAVIFQTHRQC